MPHYYVATWVGTGTAEDPFRPNATFPTTGCIDLRPNPTVAAGFCFVSSDVQAGNPAGGRYLGADLSSPLPANTRNAASTFLGFDVRGLSIADVLMQTLTEEGRTDGSRWRPLVPYRRRGAGGAIVDRWEIHLGGLAWSRELNVPSGGATYSESFDKADSTVLGPDLTWTTVAGTFSIVSNAANHGGANGTRHRGRAEHDTATVDHYVQANFTISGLDAYGDGGLNMRWSATENTHYSLMREYSTTEPVMNNYAYDVRKFVAGTETRLNTKAARASTPGELLRGEASGSTITYKADGVTLTSLTDTSIDGSTAGGRRAGLTSYRGGGGKSTWVTRWDNFEVGDLAAAIPTGSATGTWAVTGSASGTSIRAGSTTGSWTVVGSAAGVAPSSIPAGAATGTWNVAGSASGVARVAPTGLTAVARTGTSVTLEWDPVTSAAGYDLQRRANPAGEWLTIKNKHGNASYTDTGLTAGAKYDYRVRSLKSPSGLLRDPNLRRVAYTCDGNFHDTDDWGASAVAIALFSKEYKGNIVHWEYNNHIWQSNTTVARGGDWEWHSDQSNRVTAEKFGFDTTKFFSCVADGYGVYAAAARNNLVAAINASTATDRLVLICAGPMETAWQALNAADTTARQYVDCVSHSTWNEQHGDAEFEPHDGHTHGGHGWNDLDLFTPTPPNTIDISDQNGGGKLGDQNSANFSYFNTGADPWQHVWNRITVVDGATTTTDVSDAGMALYVINGMVEPSTTPNYPERIRTYLGL